MIVLYQNDNDEYSSANVGNALASAVIPLRVFAYNIMLLLCINNICNSNNNNNMCYSVCRLRWKQLLDFAHRLLTILPQ